MTTNTSAAVLSSINGRSKAETDRLITFYHISNVVQALLTYLRHRGMEDEEKHGLELRKFIEELQDNARSASNFDELASWIASDCRIIQTRSEKAVSDDNEKISMFLELPVLDMVPGETYQAKIAVPITAKHLIVTVTPEQSQDYVTMRHREGVITEEEEKLLTRLDAIDRLSVLKLWAMGYPVHAGYNHELEYMPIAYLKGCEDMNIRYAVKYTTQQELSLINRRQPGPTFYRRAGRCVPDHSCCATGMWPDDRRREFMTLGVRERESAQQKDLFDRMRSQFASQAKA